MSVEYDSPVSSYETVVKGPTKSTLGSPDLVTTVTRTHAAPAPTRSHHHVTHSAPSHGVATANIVHSVPTQIIKPAAPVSNGDFGGCCSIGPVSLAPMSPSVEGSWCHNDVGPIHVASDRMTMVRSTGSSVTAAFIDRGTYSLTYHGQMITPYTGLIAPTTDGKLLWRDKVMGVFEKDYLMTRCENFAKRPDTIYRRNGQVVGTATYDVDPSGN